MKSNKKNQKIIEEYDYLAKAASAQDCTGLIPVAPLSEAELQAYEDLYPYRPIVTEQSSSSHVSSSKS